MMHLNCDVPDWYYEAVANLYDLKPEEITYIKLMDMADDSS